MKKEAKAYQEILSVVEKYKEICIFDIEKMKSEAENHLFGIKLKEEFGINLDPRNVYSTDWVKLGKYICIGKFGENRRRTISWSDDDSQPKNNELLLYISFPTGAYIFGEDYPKDIFKDFWHELKSYKPKYCDTANNSLYFSMENAVQIFSNFEGVLKKYHEKNVIDSKRRKIEKLKLELEKLSPP